MITALIVTYNRVEKLKVCLTHTLAQPFQHVFVVNNASTDCTADYLDCLARQDARLLVLHQPENLGGAGGFDAGLRAADQHLRGHGWVVLYDDDAYPAAHTIHAFISQQERYEAESITGLAARVLSPDGDVVEVNRPILNLFQRPTECLAITRGQAHNLRDLYHIPRSWIVNSDQTGRTRVDAISFVGLFLRLDGLPRLPKWRYPAPELFLGSDDTIYTLNLARLGYILQFDPSLLFVHASQTGHSGSDWLQPIWRHYYVLRNSFRLHWCLSKLWFLPLTIITSLRHLLAAVRYAHCRRSSRLFVVLLIALWDGARGYYGRSFTNVVQLGQAHGQRVSGSA